MKLAILNDTHCGIRNSSDIFINYQKRFYEEIFFPYLLKNDIKQIVHLGDYYDNRKGINFKALQANRKMFLEKLREYNIRMDIIPGNHDVYYKNTNSLNSLKELQGHYMNEVNLIFKPKVMQYGSLKMGLIPWICEENSKECYNFIETCEADIIGAHLELSGFEVTPGHIHEGGMNPNIFSRFEQVYSGHFHCQSSKKNIKYLGSQMQFFWSDVDMKKYFHVLDTETKELTPVENPIRIYERIFYDHEKIDYEQDLSWLDKKFVKVVVLKKGDTYKFEHFIDRIQSRKVYELKISDDFSNLMGENNDDSVSVEDTEQIIYNYVDNLNTELNKSRIKKELGDLMTESQTMEIV